MLKIGSIEDNDGEYIIHREFYRQGMIFKDEEAYKFHKDQPCYSPELSDSVYTGNDFLELCNCQQDLADELFEGVDWQHPESLKEGLVRKWRMGRMRGMPGKSSIMAMGAMTRNVRIVEER